MFGVSMDKLGRIDCRDAMFGVSMDKLGVISFRDAMFGVSTDEMYEMGTICPKKWVLFFVQIVIK
jgi:hypothetical protein